jgi:hypothetical protein
VNRIEQLIQAVQAFQNAKIDFVLIGGLAMRSHGSCYMTTDIDLAYAVDFENLERLAAFLPTIHARVLGRPTNDNFVITTTTLRSVRFLNLFTDLGEVDILREIPGVESFEGLLERSASFDFGGFMVRVASLDDLIAMKRAANRPKDQNHLFELLAIKKLLAEQES